MPPMAEAPMVMRYAIALNGLPIPGVLVSDGVTDTVEDGATDGVELTS